MFLKIVGVICEIEKMQHSSLDAIVQFYRVIKYKTWMLYWYIYWKFYVVLEGKDFFVII